MLLKRRSLAASSGWLLTRWQAEAFSTFGQVPRANGIQTPSKDSTCCVGWLPFVPTRQQWSPRSFHVALGGTLPASSLLRMSTELNAVEPSVGTSSDEEPSVLDALIGQSPVLDALIGQSHVLDALIGEFTSPKNGNITATVEEYLDLCDHALLTHLRGRIESAGAQSSEEMALKHVEEEINLAMKRRLWSADANLRLVLDLAPDIKKMEATIRTYFREGKVDMAFMVMISMNLQRAKEAEGADHAVMLLTHLTTFMMAFQDERLNPEVKLLRVLLRTDCDGVRKSMLQERLQLPNQDIFLERPPDKDKVQPHLIQRAIVDMIEQVEELGQYVQQRNFVPPCASGSSRMVEALKLATGEGAISNLAVAQEAIDVGLTDSLKGLQVEINDVVKGSQRPGPFRQ